MAKDELIVLSVGGSLIVPDQIDTGFLKDFKALIEKKISEGKRFIIITGGGKTARRYQDAAKNVSKLESDDLDWLGIHATRMNGHLLRTIFKGYANPHVIKDPTAEVEFKEKILVAAGWKPGFSTDYDAVLLAKKFGAKLVINLSNIDYVYDKDPNKFKDAKRLETISWKDFRKIVGNEWNPGLNAPFDPIASREAEELKMTVIIANGAKIENLDNIISGKKFVGTTIK